MLVRGIVRRRQRQRRRKHVLPLERIVDVGQIGDALDHQPRRYQQRERKGDLRDDEPSAQASYLERRAAPRTVFQDLAHVGSGPPQRGDQPRKQARANRQEQYEEQHGGIEPYREPERDAPGERHQRTIEGHDRHLGDAEAQKAAHEGYGRRVQDLLEDHSAAPRAKRGLERDLFAPQARASQQEVGDVRTRDQEHQGNRAEHRVEQLGDLVADDLLHEGPDDDGHALIGVGVLCCELCHDPAEVGLALFHGAAFGEAAERRQRGARAAFHGEVSGRQRLPQLLIEGELETVGHDADDFRGLTVESDRATDDVPAAIETILPEPVPDQRHRQRTDQSVLRDERAADDGCRSQ